MQKTILNHQTALALSSLLERVRKDIPIFFYTNFIGDGGDKLFSNDDAVVSSLKEGIYIGQVSGDWVDPDFNGKNGLIKVTVTNISGAVSVYREYLQRYSQIKVMGTAPTTWVELATTDALKAIPLTEANPNQIEPIPSASNHTKMSKGVTYFTATAGELGIPSELVADANTVTLASVFVLTTPERKYFYEARVGNDIYVSTVTPSAELTHNWKAAGGTDETAVAALIQGLVATDVQAIDKLNNTSLMSPKAFSVAFDKALADWVGAAPEALDTIEEIAAAFQNNPDILNVMMGLINGLRTDLDQLELDLIGVNSTITQFTTNLNAVSNTVDRLSGSMTSIANRVTVLENAEPIGTASGFSIKHLDLSLPGQNLFNNADIKTIEPGLYSVELVEADLVHFDGALVNTSTLPLLATANVAVDDLRLGERVVYWTVSDGVNYITRTYKTIHSTSEILKLVSNEQLLVSNNAIFNSIENSINRVGYLVGGIVTTFTGTVVKGGPIAMGALESNVKVRFTPAGEILCISPNPVIQAKLDELVDYWLPYEAVATDYTFKYTLTGGTLDEENSTMTMVYSPMTPSVSKTLSVKAMGGYSASAVVTVFIKHTPTGNEKTIKLTLQAFGNYFN